MQPIAWRTARKSASSTPKRTVSSTLPPPRVARARRTRTSPRCWRLIDADDAGLDLARSLIDQRGGEADLWTDLAASPSFSRPARAPSDARRDVVRTSHPAIRARSASHPGPTQMARGFKAVDEGAPRGPAGCLSRVPIYYITNRFTVVRNRDHGAWPRYSEVMDYELEVAIVTRRTRANIPDEAARAYLRLYDLQRLFRSRPAGGRNAGSTRPREGQELRRRERHSGPGS